MFATCRFSNTVMNVKALEILYSNSASSEHCPLYHYNTTTKVTVVEYEKIILYPSYHSEAKKQERPKR